MNSISKNLKCVQLRTGVEIWMEAERAEKLMDIFGAENPPQFARYEGRMINKSDLVGIFLPEDMDSSTRRKNGEWHCKQGNWHSKGEKCECINLEQKKAIQKREEAIARCGKCTSGWVRTQDGAVTKCDCIKNL